MVRAIRHRMIETLSLNSKVDSKLRWFEGVGKYEASCLQTGCWQAFDPCRCPDCGYSVLPVLRCAGAWGDVVPRGSGERGVGGGGQGVNGMLRGRGH